MKIIGLILCFLLSVNAPKPKLKGIWYSLKDNLYIEMHISGNDIWFLIPGQNDVFPFLLQLKSDSLILEDLKNSLISRASYNFRGSDTLEIYYPGKDELMTFYRHKESHVKLKNKEKIIKEMEKRSKEFPAPPGNDSFIYFQF